MTRNMTILACLAGALIAPHAASTATARTRIEPKAQAALNSGGAPRQASERRAWLGTALANLTDVDRKQKGVPRYGGVVVLRVLQNSPASRTGFVAGDVIMRLSDNYVYKPEDIIKRVASTPVGRSIKIDVIRNGGWLTATVKLAARPASIPPVASGPEPQSGRQPGTTAPRTTAPGTTAPRTTAPRTTAPKGGSPREATPKSSAPRDRASRQEGAAATPQAQAAPASGTMASRLQALEREVRSLREAIGQMKRQCSR